MDVYKVRGNLPLPLFPFPRHCRTKYRKFLLGTTLCFSCSHSCLSLGLTSQTLDHSYLSCDHSCVQPACSFSYFFSTQVSGQEDRKKNKTLLLESRIDSFLLTFMGPLSLLLSKSLNQFDVFFTVSISELSFILWKDVLVSLPALSRCSLLFIKAIWLLGMSFIIILPLHLSQYLSPFPSTSESSFLFFLPQVKKYAATFPIDLSV